MPFAGYKDFADCVKKNSSKKNPKAYCAVIMRKVEKEGEVVRERRINDLFDINEAEFEVEENTGRLRCKTTILKAGRSKNPRNYREEAVRKAAEDGTFTGLRMFVNHSEQPPLKRSLTEMVSAVESTSYDSEKKAIIGEVEFFNKDFYEFAKRAKSYMGTSINALARGNRVRQPNGEVIEDITEIVKGHSVDWVIFPAAGGEIQQFLESEGAEEVEWDKITLEDLQKNLSPALWDEIEKAIVEKEKGPEDLLESPEPTSPDNLDAKIAEAIKKYEEEKAQEAAEAAARSAHLEDVVGKSGLPEPTRRRLVAQFATVPTLEDVKIAEAIQLAKEELTAAGAGPHITGMGPSEGTAAISDHPAGILVSEAVDEYFKVSKK